MDCQPVANDDFKPPDIIVTNKSRCAITKEHRVLPESIKHLEVGPKSKKIQIVKTNQSDFKREKKAAKIAQIDTSHLWNQDRHNSLAGKYCFYLFI